jgi:hypothetical protein
MNVLGTVVDRILAVVSQRAFWTEVQIRELVRDDNEKKMEAFYGHTDKTKSATRLNNLRAMRIFATDEQQTWLVADCRMAYSVLDDRRLEEPRIKWRFKLDSVLPVHADENWSTTAGVLGFGNRTQKLLYTKEMFTNEPAAVVINHFLSGSNG